MKQEQQLYLCSHKCEANFKWTLESQAKMKSVQSRQNIVAYSETGIKIKCQGLYKKASNSTGPYTLWHNCKMPVKLFYKLGFCMTKHKGSIYTSCSTNLGSEKNKELNICLVTNFYTFSDCQKEQQAYSSKHEKLTCKFVEFYLIFFYFCLLF